MHCACPSPTTARFARFTQVAALVLAATAAAGCATTEPTPVWAPVPSPALAAAHALSVGDVARMVELQRPAADIVAEVRERGMRSAPNTADVELLLKSGASREVVDAVLAARVATPGAMTIVQPRTTYVYPWWGPSSFSLGVGSGWGWGSSVHYGATWGPPGWGSPAWGPRPWGWGGHGVWARPVVPVVPVVPAVPYLPGRVIR